MKAVNIVNAVNVVNIVNAVNIVRRKRHTALTGAYEWSLDAMTRDAECAPKDNRVLHAVCCMPDPSPSRPSP